MSSSSSTAIDDLIAEIDTTPVGPQERDLIARALALAEEAADDDRAFQLRLRLTTSAHMSGDTDAMFSSFGWCVGKNDEDAARFPLISEGNDLLFQYKWMAGRLATNPSFPLSQLDAIHADMSERYRRAGVSQSGVLQSRFATAMDTGELRAAGRYREERELIPRDDYSHCEACVRSEDAFYFSELGEDETALRLYDEIFDGHLTCGEEPEASEAQALLPFLRAGRLDDARRAHLRSYRVARYSPDSLGIIANHLVFCAVTGNESRGLSILERQLGEVTLDPLNRSLLFSVSSAIAVLLDAVTAAGAGDTPVRGAENPDLLGLFGPHDGPWNASDLAARMWERAQTLAAEFNARNGNDYFTLRLNRSRALAEEHYDLPLQGERFTPPSPTTHTEPVSSADWLGRARASFLTENAQDILDAVGSGLAVEDGDLDSRLSLFGCGAQALLTLERTEDAAGFLALRAEELRAAGREAQAAVEDRLGVLLFGAAGEEDLPVLTAELERARVEQAPAIVLSDLLLTTADLHMRGQRHGAALPLAAEALVLAEDNDLEQMRVTARLVSAYAELNNGDMPAAVVHLDTLLASPLVAPMRVNVLRLRAQVHGASGEPSEGAALADQMLTLVAESGSREGVILAAQLAANLLSDDNRDGEAAARIEYALEHARLAESEEQNALRFLLGRYQHWAGENAAAVENLDAVFRAQGPEVPATQRSETLFWLGQAAQGAEENGLAYGALSQAIELAEEGEAYPLAARAGITLGQLLAQFDDPDAVAVLERALAHSDLAEDATMSTMARHRLGQARAAHGDPAGLEDLAAVEQIAREQGADWLIAEVTDSTARALGALGRGDEAIAAALRAADAFADCGDEGNAAMAELFVARALGESRRLEEAVPMYRAAIDRLAPGTPPFIGLNLELGSVLESLERHEEAAAARAAAERE
ncbi:hypothetical protein [Mycetocola spongiae]|uniref:hypothetical protein n=1 Tax=Mycetocola spongiae TaxID=2859226 RepID=UPI001CF290A1|nr:hypothetical protein [Mycetocola spongiae]UCR88203.1 hypothetical protein KXZ72_09405 [Mycetocola spongiae]